MNMFQDCRVQSTPELEPVQGNCRIENSSSYREFEANDQKWGNGMGEECKYHVHFSSREARDILIFWNLATKPRLITLNIIFELDRRKIKNLKEKDYTIALREVQCFGLQLTEFFSKFHPLKTWFELSSLKLYRNDLKGNKNSFE